MIEQCLARHKACPQRIKLNNGEAQSAWHVIRRLAKLDSLSGQGKIEDVIDTTGIAAGYIFKQSTPRSVAEQLSQIEVLGVTTPLYSCEQCAQRVSGYLEELNMLPDIQVEQE